MPELSSEPEYTYFYIYFDFTNISAHRHLIVVISFFICSYLYYFICVHLLLSVAIFFLSAVLSYFICVYPLLSVVIFFPL